MKLNKLLPLTLLFGITLTSCGYSKVDITGFIKDADKVIEVMSNDDTFKDIAYTKTTNFIQAFGSNVKEFSNRIFATFDADNMIKKERRENLKGNGTSEIIETYTYLKGDDLVKVNMNDKTYQIIDLTTQKIGLEDELGYKNDILDVLSSVTLGLKSVANDDFSAQKEDYARILAYDDPTKINNGDYKLNFETQNDDHLRFRLNVPIDVDVEDDKMHLESHGLDELKVNVKLYKEITYSHVINAEAKYKLNDQSEYRHALKEETQSFIYKNIELEIPDISGFTLIK